jgi:hypothetical protein
VQLLYRALLARGALPVEVDHHLRWTPTVSAVLEYVMASEEYRRRDQAHRELSRRAFIASLQALNDVLETGPLAGRWWVWGGLLLGWARERAPLADDLADADFAVMRSDLRELINSVPALAGTGFEPLSRHWSNAGDCAEVSFWRDGAKFEFFVMDSVSPGKLQYRIFGAGDHGEGPLEAVAEISDQSLVPFEFLGRTWLKHANHEAELAAIYGDWRTPAPGWSYMADHGIIERTAWRRSGDLAWDGRADG